jgi:hypothetical protein
MVSAQCPRQEETQQDYYTKLDDEIHLTAFGKRLDNKQTCIEHSGVTISNEG